MKALRFNSLVLEITYRCNARCAICYQGAGPKGSDLRGDGRLPLDLVLRVIDEAVQLPEIAPRLHLSGGEAFLRYEDSLAIFRHGRSRGIMNVGTTTNGFWAADRDTAERCCDELATAGLTYFEVSIDYWHLPYVSADRIRNLLWAARRTGITTVLRTLSSRSHDVDELLEAFSDEDLLGALVANGRVFRVGRGALALPADEVYYGRGPEGCCESLLNLTVAPNGSVYPCCAGADITAALSAGNVYRDALADTLFKMRTDRMIRHVIHAGSPSLIPIVRELGYGDRLLPQYASMCHLCWHLFSDDEVAGALRRHFDELQIADLIDFLSGVPAPELAAVGEAD